MLIRTTVTLVVATLWLAAARARASNEDDFFVGNEAAITAGAVTATVADGSASFYNQAGLAHVQRARVDVTAAAYGLRFYSVPAFLAVRGGPSRDASVMEVVAIPTQVGYVRKLSDGVVLGLGYFVPQSANALLSERLNVPDSGSIWAFDARVTSSSYWLVAALGLRVSERLRVGLGLFGVYVNDVESSTLFGSTARGDMTRSAIQYSTLSDTSRLSAVAGVGMQLDLGRGWTIGASIRGPRLQLLSFGRSSLNVVGTSLQDGADPQLSVDSRSDRPDDQLGIVHLGRYFLGVAYRFGPARVTLDADFQPGLISERLDVQRSFAFNVRAGMYYELDSNIKVGAGLFSDRSSEVELDAFRTHFYGGTLGVQLNDILNLAAGERADTLMLSSTFALRYAYGSGRIETLVAEGRGDIAQLLGTGGHTQRIHELSLHVGSTLHF